MLHRRAPGATAEARVVEHHRRDAVPVEQRLGVGPVRDRFRRSVKDEQRRRGIRRRAHERRIETTVTARDRDLLERGAVHGRCIGTLPGCDEPLAFHDDERDAPNPHEHHREDGHEQRELPEAMAHGHALRWPRRIVGITGRYCFASRRRNSSVFRWRVLATNSITVDPPAAGPIRNRTCPPGTVTKHVLADDVAGAQRRDAHSSIVASTAAGAARTTHQRDCTSQPAMSTATAPASAPDEKRSPRAAVTVAATRMYSAVTRNSQSPRTTVGSRRASTIAVATSPSTR